MKVLNEEKEIRQLYSDYSEDDHRTWAILLDRLKKVTYNNSSREYQHYFELLDFEPEKVVNVAELNTKLAEMSGWQVLPCSGLIKSIDFFRMLADRKFPVTISMRRPDEIGFSKLPDIFHDICGHVPMLLNPIFSNFMIEFSTIGLKYIKNEEAVTWLDRLYWYTLETGLIKEDGELRFYGGAIITSSREIGNILNPMVPKHLFDINQVINTSYSPYALQKEYFVTESFEELFLSLGELKEILGK